MVKFYDTKDKPVPWYKDGRREPEPFDDEPGEEETEEGVHEEEESQN
jgi:hypothetical protein